MLKVLFVGLILSTIYVPCDVWSKPAYFNTLMSEVSGGKFTHRCQTCHVGGAQLNQFGKDFSKIKNLLGIDYSTRFWQELKSLDSDHDGVSNQDEIMKGTNPGKKDS